MKYSDWKKTAICKETIQVNRTTIRYVWETPNKVKLIETTVIPWNIFEDIYSFVWVDITLKYSKEYENLVVLYGGKLEQQFYAEEGYFFPYFDDLEKAYTFAVEQKDNLIKMFKDKL